MGVLRNEIAQLRRLVPDLRGKLGEVLTRHNDLERSFEERLDRHREDIDWNREECILLRTGLQENEDRTAELTVRGQQMARRLCRCADRQGPPISAVGSPQLPPYTRSPSPEFHTPPLEFMPVANLPSSPPSPTALPVPPPISQSPSPLPEQENVPPACCSHPPITEGPLVPVEEEIAPQFWRTNQSRAAGRRVVRASNLVRPHPYAHAKSVGSLWDQRTRGLQQLGGPGSSDEGTSSREDCVLSDRAPNRWNAGSSGVEIGGQEESLPISGGNSLW